MLTLTITNLNIFLEAALTPKPLKFKNRNSLGVGGPLKLKFANHLSKASLQGTFGTGRLHSELWDWGVKSLLFSFWELTRPILFELADTSSIIHCYACFEQHLIHICLTFYLCQVKCRDLLKHVIVEFCADTTFCDGSSDFSRMMEPKGHSHKLYYYELYSL